MMEKEYEGHGMEECCCRGWEHWPKEFQRDFKVAKLKKKEKMLEAKLEFVREMAKLVQKISPETGEMKE